jgi:hypothetical protein
MNIRASRRNMLFTTPLLLMFVCSANTKQLKCVNMPCLANKVARNVMHSFLLLCLHSSLFSFHLRSQMVTVSLEQLVKRACDELAQGGR